MRRTCKYCCREFVWTRNGFRSYCCEECRNKARRDQMAVNYRVYRKKQEIIRNAPYSMYLDILVKNAQRSKFGAERLRKYIISLTERNDYEDYQI